MLELAGGKEKIFIADIKFRKNKAFFEEKRGFCFLNPLSGGGTSSGWNVGLWDLARTSCVAFGKLLNFSLSW